MDTVCIILSFFFRVYSIRVDSLEQLGGKILRFLGRGGCGGGPPRQLRNRSRPSSRASSPAASPVMSRMSSRTQLPSQMYLPGAVKKRISGGSIRKLLKGL